MSFQRTSLIAVFSLLFDLNNHNYAIFTLEIPARSVEKLLFIAKAN